MKRAAKISNHGDLKDSPFKTPNKIPRQRKTSGFMSPMKDLSSPFKSPRTRNPSGATPRYDFT